MDKMTIYNAVRKVPDNAQKTIVGGRLKGKTDINPMWRIKALTEQFGICGIGWKYTIEDQWIEEGASDEVAAFCNISLYVKVDGEWSDAIPGTGGSMFVAKEKSGLYTSDECYKMALTDAISVACKALGFGADIYWQDDASKYDRSGSEGKGKEETRDELIDQIVAFCGGDVNAANDYCQKAYQGNSLMEMTPEMLKHCRDYIARKKAERS